MSLTNYSEYGILARILGVAPDGAGPNPEFVQPSSVFLGLLSSAPGEDGGGDEVPASNGEDLGVTGYARQPVLFTVTAGDPTVATNSNNVAFVFPAQSLGAGTVSHAAIYDQSALGNMLVYFTLKSGETESPVTLGPDSQLQFPAGSIVISLD